MGKTIVKVFQNDLGGHEYEIDGIVVASTMQSAEGSREWLCFCDGDERTAKSLPDATEIAGNFIESRYGDYELVDGEEEEDNDFSIFDVYGIEGVANMLGMDECEVESIAYDMGYL